MNALRMPALLETSLSLLSAYKFWLNEDTQTTRDVVVCLIAAADCQCAARWQTAVSAHPTFN